LHKLRGHQHDCAREVQEIQCELQVAVAQRFTLDKVKTPLFYKPMIVIFGLMMAQQMSGK
jgi:hypothetical protein